MPVCGLEWMEDSMAAEHEQTEAAAQTAAQFATTHWSLVSAAAHGGSTAARRALADLCQIYWYPLYAYARHRGLAADTARDLTQGFFEHLIEHQIVASADAAKGRFRAFLLACFKNFMASEHARATRQKRGGGQPVFSLDAPGAEERFGRELADHASPEVLYERRWAVAVLDEAMRRLRQEFVTAGRERTFELLSPRLEADRDGASIADLAAQLGAKEGTVRVMVHRLRRRYRDLLHLVVLRTVATPAEVTDELRHLFQVLEAP
jgi:RNA polymerase sigma factor (sigma-70 family)